MITIRIAIVYHSETGNTRKMAEFIKQGCDSVEDVESRTIPIDNIDEAYIAGADAVLFGCPTYEGSASWQMKKLLDTISVDLAGKLGGVFASQNWPGGGGADFTEITLIAGMLVRGMMIYSGGITKGDPFLHFGAVSEREPKGLYQERCVKLGENIASKAKELWGQGGGL
jgi:NAD(P)H dehydrogenase (quinone)